ncbi:MMPL family transporter [Streptomyces sp. S1A(2023)]
MLVLSALAMVVCAGVSVGLWGQLVSGGFDASGTEAVGADAYTAEVFGAGEAHLTLVVHADGRVDAPAAAAAGRTLTRRLTQAAGVASVASYWDGRDPLLRSATRDSALVLAVLAGTEDQRVRTAGVLVPSLTGEQGPLRVEATGSAWMGAEVVDRTERDLLRAELVTAPLVFLMLVLAFRSVLAALLPVAVAVVSTVVALACLRPLASLVELSMFAPNLTTALGFGLAVDYCLFLLTRFRRERAAGHEVAAAARTAARTAGRTVVFSVVTVALVMACLLVFPVPFLRSMAWAGITVAVSSGAVVLLVVPAVLLLAGDRLAGSAPGEGGRGGGEWEAGVGWHRFAAMVCRRARRMAGGSPGAAVGDEPATGPPPPRADRRADAARPCLLTRRGHRAGDRLPRDGSGHHPGGGPAPRGVGAYGAGGAVRIEALAAARGPGGGQRGRPLPWRPPARSRPHRVPPGQRRDVVGRARERGRRVAGRRRTGPRRTGCAGAGDDGAGGW